VGQLILKMANYLPIIFMCISECGMVESARGPRK